MSKKGFTIVEIIVAAFLLLTLLMVATPLLYQLMRYQRDSNNADDLNDNVQYLLMILEKELATGSDIQSTGTTGISFKNQEDDPVEYTVSSGVLTKKVDLNNDGDFSDTGESSVINSTDEFLITNIRIVDNQELDLDGNGTADDSGMVHLVTLFLQAKSVVGQDGFQTKLPIQMSIIPRNQNLNN